MIVNARARLARPLLMLGAAVLLASGSAVAFAGAASADAALPSGAVIDQQSNDENQYCSNTDQEAFGIGQTFTAGASGNLTTLTLDIVANSNTGPTTISVYATASGLPTGSALGSASFTGATYSGYLNFATPIPVVSGTVYAFVLPAGVEVGCQGPGGYSRGNLVTSDGEVWTASTLDLHFDSYVAPAAAPVAPVAQNVAVTTSEQWPVTVPVTYTGTADSYSIVTPASHGTASILAQGTAVYYVPAAGYVGPDSFTFTANNGTAHSAPATVTVTVTQPTLTLSSSSVALGGQVTITGSGFPAGVSQVIVLHSTPVTLGTVTTSATGGSTLTTTVPVAVGAGSHTITASSGTTPITATAALTVTGTALAATGTDDAWMLWLGAALLLVGGSGLGIATHRRRRGRAA